MKISFIALKSAHATNVNDDKYVILAVSTPLRWTKRDAARTTNFPHGPEPPAAGAATEVPRLGESLRAGRHPGRNLQPDGVGPRVGPPVQKRSRYQPLAVDAAVLHHALVPARRAGLRSYLSPSHWPTRVGPPTTAKPNDFSSRCSTSCKAFRSPPSLSPSCPRWSRSFRTATSASSSVASSSSSPARRWNMTFSFYYSLKALPDDFKFVGHLARFTPWQRFTRIELPFATKGLVYNSMVSVAGGWFFLSIIEAFQLGDQDYRVKGIGSYMSVAKEAHDNWAQFYARHRHGAHDRRHRSTHLAAASRLVEQVQARGHRGRVPGPLRRSALLQPLDALRLAGPILRETLFPTADGRARPARASR